MFSLRHLPARGARSSICTQCVHLSRSSSRPLSSITTKLQFSRQILPSHSLLKSRNLPSSRNYSTKTSADEIIEEIQDQYATARDEFEIASEETEKKTVYAADDRAAAREELDKLKGMFEKALEGADGEEVKSRVGQRIRELENAVVNLERSATED